MHPHMHTWSPIASQHLSRMAQQGPEPWGTHVLYGILYTVVSTVVQATPSEVTRHAMHYAARQHLQKDGQRSRLSGERDTEVVVAHCWPAAIRVVAAVVSAAMCF